jgi:hypothetical protein
VVFFKLTEYTVQYLDQRLEKMPDPSSVGKNSGYANLVQTITKNNFLTYCNQETIIKTKNILSVQNVKWFSIFIPLIMSNLHLPYAYYQLCQMGLMGPPEEYMII